MVRTQQIKQLPPTWDIIGTDYHMTRSISIEHGQQLRTYWIHDLNNVAVISFHNRKAAIDWAIAENNKYNKP